MYYPNSFKEKVMKIYPDRKDFHIALEKGDAFLGFLLKESARDKISIDEILEASSLEQLQKQARAEKEKFLLYQEWRTLG